MPQGLLLLDKPSGPTSHDMVARVRRGTGERRVGHAGTLDPLATGLLVLCLGSATRLSEYLAGKDKRYSARLRLGATTDTYDAQGAVTYAHAGPLPDREQAEAALATFRGSGLQVPPQYSAIKRGGQKAYEAARRGEALALEPRPVTFFSLELVSWELPECVVDVHCSAGTYIRSLAHDLGQALGCGAHLAALRRTASGALEVSEAVADDTLTEAMAAGEWQQYLRPADLALADWPAVHVSAEAAARLRHGQAIGPAAPGAEPAGFARAYGPAGDFFAILRAGPDGWHPHKVFSETATE